MPFGTFSKNGDVGIDREKDPFVSAHVALRSTLQTSGQNYGIWSYLGLDAPSH